MPINNRKLLTDSKIFKCTKITMLHNVFFVWDSNIPTKIVKMKLPGFDVGKHELKYCRNTKVTQ